MSFFGSVEEKPDLRLTYDKLEYVWPALIFLRYDKVWKDNKTQWDKRSSLFSSAVVALMREAHKFKVIFLNLAFKQKIWTLCALCTLDMATSLRHGG